MNRLAARVERLRGLERVRLVDDSIWTAASGWDILVRLEGARDKPVQEFVARHMY